MLVSIVHLSKSYGASRVLNDVTFLVNAEDRLALVGPNGVGKSTLLRILAGELAADGGEVCVPRPIDIGYLPQAIEARPGQTIDALVKHSLGRIGEIERRLREVERLLAHDRPGAPAEAMTSLLEEHGTLTEQFERLGGYDLEHRVEAVFAGLAIAHLQRDREVMTLSGGEKARVGLAALLLRAPDLLLLDEPTNHLDFAALEWLESYLRTQRGAFLVVSHDRRFLNRTVTAIVEIDEHLRDARVFPGNYDAYLAAKASERAKWEELYAREQAEMKELRAVARGSAHRVGHPNRPPPDKDKYSKTFFGERVQQTISRNIRAAQEKLRRLEEDPIVKPPDPLRIRTDFQPDELAGHEPLIANGLCKAYGSRRVLSSVSLTVRASSRLVIVGPNGAGKTTLLRLLAGYEKPDAGTVTRSPSVRIGYLDQEQEDVDLTQTVFAAYAGGLTGREEALKADLFRHGFFTYEDLGKRVRELSIGQRRKLQIARLVARRANVLLLDEPTNHVDLATLEAFEAALGAFPGPVVAVSHDRWFIERFGGQVWELSPGQGLRPVAPLTR